MIKNKKKSIIILIIIIISVLLNVNIKANSDIPNVGIDQYKQNIESTKEINANDLNNFMANQVQFEGTPTVLFVDKGLVNQDLN